MKTRLWWGLALVVLAAAGVALFGRTWLAQRAFDRAVQTAVGVDQSLSLPDGLHAYVCGSGSPMPDATRAGPCIAVLAGRQGFVFDAGSGSIRKLQRMGFPIDRLQGAYLTHLHSDHIDGLGELMLQAWIAGGRSALLPISGPAGTEAVVGGLMTAYQADRGFRIAHHGPAIARPDGYGAAARVIAIDGARMLVHDHGGVRITAFPVIHDPVRPAFGYRIDYRGRSIVISGDTVYAPALVAAARGTDVLFHDAMNKAMIGAIGDRLKTRGRADYAQIMADIQGYHASPHDAARAAREAGARALVLYHLVPAPPARLIEPLFIGDAGKTFAGPLKLADDGMIVSLPAGGSAIDFSTAW